MNYYLRLVAYPMFIRFELHKAVGKAAQDGFGTVVILLRFPLSDKTYTQYGPYDTLIQAQEAVWKNRRSIRPTDTARELNRQIQAYQNDSQESHAELSRQNRELSTPIVIDGPSMLTMLRRLQAGKKLSPRHDEAEGSYYRTEPAQ